MRRIFYSNDSVLTGTEITRALLDYAAALARQVSSDTVDIPVRQSDGSITRASLLIGPASQLIAEDEESDFEELRDDIAVATMRAKTAEISSSRAVAAEAASTTADEIAPNTDDSIEWL